VRVVILHRIDPRRGGPYLRAQRKLYLVDPLLAYLPRHLRQSDASPKMTALAENAVVMALFHDSPSEGSTAGGDSITTGAIADP
jgi:predicted AAA+ superfamily ATPase